MSKRQPLGLCKLPRFLLLHLPPSFHLLDRSTPVLRERIPAVVQLEPQAHACMCAKSLQPCSTTCNPVDCSRPGYSVQTRIQEWVARPSSRASSPPWISCLLHWQVGPLPVAPPGNPLRPVHSWIIGLRLAPRMHGHVSAPGNST